MISASVFYGGDFCKLKLVQHVLCRMKILAAWNYSSRSLDSVFPLSTFLMRVPLSVLKPKDILYIYYCLNSGCKLLPVNEVAAYLVAVIV